MPDQRSFPPRPPIVDHATLQTAQAERRLAILTQRANKPTANLRTVLDAVFGQWRTTIEDLRASSDLIAEYEMWATAAQQEYHALSTEMAAFFELIPVPCVWTAPDGEILKANEPAAALLATSTRHLIGRTLNLYFEDRAAFSRMVTTAVTLGEVVEETMVVKPREHRPVAVQLRGRSLGEHVIAWCIDPGPSGDIGPPASVRRARTER